VVLDGRVLVEDRQLLTLDLAETLGRARELARQVRGAVSTHTKLRSTTQY
jgi:hypothetical protein